MKLLSLLILILFSVPALADEAPKPADNKTAEPEVSDAELTQIAALISNQIRPCWKIPSGNTEPLETIIEIDPQGNMTFGGFTSGIKPEQKELADSIERAIEDKKCNPLKKLPDSNLYSVWQKLALIFAPRS